MIIKEIILNKLKQKIKKKISEIFLFKLNFIFKKKELIHLSHIYISKNFKFINIYINFINQKNKNIIKHNIKQIQKYENFIKKKIKETSKIRYIPKIYFLYDTFNERKNNIINLIKKANKNIYI